jgi:signal transduction histidine kinase
LLLACLLVSGQSQALVQDVTLSHWDAVFYTALLSGIVFSAAIVFAYRSYPWLGYVGLALLLTLCVAGVEGVLPQLLGGSDFAVWVVPFLLNSTTAAYGLVLVALQIDAAHSLKRFSRLFLWLALIAAFFPLSSYFWLEKISIVIMWVPVNFLFFLMVLLQALPPLTWPDSDRFLTPVVRLIPWLIGIVAVSPHLLSFFTAAVDTETLNMANRIALVMFAAYSLLIVVWQAFIAAREKVEAERQVVLAAKNEAEMKLALLKAEREYEQALAVVADHRSRLATVSHDLKQPISALRIAIEGIQQSGDDAERLSQAVDYIASLAHAYIDEGVSVIARGDVGMEDERESISSRLLSETLKQMFADDANKAGVSLRIHSCDVDLSVNPVLMLRVMNNLLSNAFKHAGATTVLAGFRRRGNGAVFQVHDNGCGMNESQLEKALSTFGKSDESEGQGLGLGIVQELCRNQGIGFAIQSLPGRGTSVSLTIHNDIE